MRQSEEQIERKIDFCHKIFRLEELDYVEQTQNLTCDQIKEIGEIVNYLKNYSNK